MKPVAILLLLITTFFSSKLMSANTVKGTVQDIHKRPLAAVTIRLLNSDTTVLSDSQGKFSISIPAGLKRVTLSFETADFHSQTLRIVMDSKIVEVRVLLIPREHLKEEISVTALNEPEQSVSVPMAENRVSQLEIQEKIPENIVSTMLNTPGIHFIGKGGISVTPSIRGLARRRVLVLVDGARLSSDRRVGVSAELIPPEFTRRIEIVRSASSVIYGSDAIGGVIQVLTLPEDIDTQKNALNLSLNSNQKRLNSGIMLYQKIGNLKISSGFQFSRAGNYTSPNGEIFNSGYTYYSGRLDLTINSDKRELSLGYLGGFGQDVGKPERGNNPDEYSFVPKESEQFIRLNYREKSIIRKGHLNLSLFVNPSRYQVEKLDLLKKSSQQADTDVTNLGLKLTLKKSLMETFSYRVGFEWFSRQNLRMENRDIENGILFSTALPLSKGHRNDYGLFFTLDYSGLPGFDIMTGIRYSLFSISADVGGQPMEKSSGAPSAFFAITRKLGRSISLFFNMGKAFRLPSLSETYYTGITGRRFVIGNPQLEPESSFNMDAGIKLFSEKYFLGVYGFYYRINDLIERYRNQDDNYTYDNVDRGRISGGEIELQLFPVKNLELFGHFFYYRGRSTATGEPLNDIPSPKLFLGAKFFVDRCWVEINYTHSFPKTDPGPAEIGNGDYTLLDLKGGYYFSARFFLYLKAANLLNRPYYANPDPDIPEGQGISFSAGLHLYF